MTRQEKISELVGETLAFCDEDPSDDKILLTTVSGRKFLFYHSQDCCETVQIESTEGEWRTLIGKVIEVAEHSEEDASESYESGTKTTLTFKVDGATVISRWVGSSNGYYSESVDIEELTQPGGGCAR